MIPTKIKLYVNVPLFLPSCSYSILIYAHKNIHNKVEKKKCNFSAVYVFEVLKVNSKVFSLCFFTLKLQLSSTGYQTVTEGLQNRVQTN